jgi:hypothetical protein
MITRTDLDSAHCAALPADALAVLADLRREAGVTIAFADGLAWVRWDPSLTGEVLRRVLPVGGVELYALREGLWYPVGRRLPAFGLGVEGAEALPLDRALTPRPVKPEPPERACEPPVALALVRDDRPREASALSCGPGELGRWAGVATTARLNAVRAARAGDRVMLLGRPLPPLAGAVRFWGDRVLVPLGLRSEPDLPEPALRGALGAEETELLVLTPEGFELVPLAAFRRLTRGSARLAAGGRSP